MNESTTVGEAGKKCTSCSRFLATSEFYKKKNRLEARCKECLKKIRAKEYRKKKDLPEEYVKGRVTKVIVNEQPVPSVVKFRREIEAVELILENLVYKALVGKLKKGA